MPQLGVRGGRGFKPLWALILIGVVVVTCVATATVILAQGAGPTSPVAREIRQLMSPTTQVGDLSKVVVRVDTSATKTRAISPDIYGVATADPPTLRALNATVDRWGGNSASRYNWVNGHAWNAARDWQFRNGNYGQPTGNVADSFVAEAHAAGAMPLMSVPALGWVAKNDDNNARSLGVPDQGGPPVALGSSRIAGYDPAANQARTSVRSEARKPGPLVDQPPPSSPVVYQDEWVHHLVDRFGAASVPFYTVDNEPDLWDQTHTDVHPTRMGYNDMLTTFETYATAIKAQDSNAAVFGPDLSGWTGMLYSSLDRGSDNFATRADRSAHGGQAFLPWWLSQVAAQDRQHGRRTLDYLDVHWYPQGNGVFSDETDAVTRALRVRSTRDLWDPTYTDESWIGVQTDLIPRLRAWIDQYYPGTKLAITEYNWGGERDASGAVALADVLGIFGREGVDLATYWTYPDPSSPAGAAFRLYRNYDGHDGSFGDLSLPVKVNEPGVSAFAARHSGSKELDVVVANESPNQTATVGMSTATAGFQATDVYTVSGNSGRIEHAPLTGATVRVAPYSVSLVRLEGR
jgi:hypothetical protein